MDPRDSPPYLLWLFIIIIGVTVGNLASAYITARVAAYAVQQATDEVAKSLQDWSKQMKAQSEQAQAAQNAQLRRNRENSVLARKLAAQCNDWTRSFGETKSAYAQEQMNRRCGQLRAYVDNGITPRDY